MKYRFSLGKLDFEHRESGVGFDVGGKEIPSTGATFARSGAELRLGSAASSRLFARSTIFAFAPEDGEVFGFLGRGFSRRVRVGDLVFPLPVDVAAARPRREKCVSDHPVPLATGGIR